MRWEVRGTLFETSGETIVICPNCGEDNSSNFKFCGMCGTSLEERRPLGAPRVVSASDAARSIRTETETRTPARTPVTAEPVLPTTGPSFLGLSEPYDGGDNRSAGGNGSREQSFLGQRHSLNPRSRAGALGAFSCCWCCWRRWARAGGGPTRITTRSGRGSPPVPRCRRTNLTTVRRPQIARPVIRHRHLPRLQNRARLLHRATGTHRNRGRRLPLLRHRLPSKQLRRRRLRRKRLRRRHRLPSPRNLRRGRSML